MAVLFGRSREITVPRRSGSLLLRAVVAIVKFESSNLASIRNDSIC